MSTPSTPRQTGGRSAASSPCSGAATEQLTPRSKVKALLAALDDDSDDLPSENVTKSCVPLAHATDKTLKDPQTGPFAQEESGDDNDDVVAPRGKLTARLHANNAINAAGDASASASASEEDGDVYARIRKQLLQKPDENVPTLSGDEKGSKIPEAGSMRVRRFLMGKKTVPETSQGQSPVFQSTTNSMGLDRDNGASDNHHAQYRAEDAQSTNLSDNGEQDSDSDLPADVLKNDRFRALVARKREERKAKEAAEEAKRGQRAALQASTAKESEDNLAPEIFEGETGDEDEETGRRLTQRSRPVRKAGKKAMEEMNRETQRISRNMQLTHEAKTRKKITKESLLERFKTKRNTSTTLVQASSSTVNSSAPTSDVEGTREKHTPPTSPERSTAAKSKVSLVPETSLLEPAYEDELPDLDEALKNQRVDKGKGRAPEPCFEEIEPTTGVKHANSLVAMSASAPLPQKKDFLQRPIKLRPPKNQIRPDGFGNDSDSDLEIIPSNKSAPSRLEIFDRLPAKKATEDKSLITLRALAHLSSPSKKRHKSDRASMHPSELGAALRMKARQQAVRERTEKIDELRKKGMIVQTSEERQRDQLAVEDMLEKARREVDELTKKEKEAAKKEKRENGEDDGLDSSDDEDYEDQEVEDVELSGSEEDGDESDDGTAEDIEEEENRLGLSNDLIDDAASEASQEQEEQEEEDVDVDSEGSEQAESESEPDMAVMHNRRRAGGTKVLDEDDEEQLAAQPSPMYDHSRIDDEANFTVRSGKPGLTSSTTIANPFGSHASILDAPMGLTQAFNATMADSQLEEPPIQDEGDSLDQLRTLTAPEFPDLEMDSIVRDTPTIATAPLDIDLHLTQTQLALDSLPQEHVVATATQISEIPDPTQDVGFEKSSPITSRFIMAPPSTIDTVIVSPKKLQEAIALKRRGRLRRRAEVVAVFSDEEDSLHLDAVADDRKDQDDGFAISAHAFDVLKNGASKAKKREDQFNKQKSNAKEMVEEQAVESEDEYAGLGGASDDSEGEEDEEVKKMIDEAHVDVDERKIAAYFADKNRAEDEAAISKLYRDINSGALRRKRGAGADFDDLDDSDDDAEARQRRKRREFARMRKALLDGDSNVIKIAEDPKKLAFLKAIEDRDDFDEDVGFLESTPKHEEGDEEEESQDIVPDSQTENKPPITALKRKRSEPLGEQMLPSTKKQNSGTNNRRTRALIARKPASLAEIRASVSFLIEEPQGLIDEAVGPSIFDASSDIELEDTGVNSTEDILPGAEPSASMSQHKNPRRTGPRAGTPVFIDRLSLKRQESSKDSSASDGRLAFFDPRSSSDKAYFKAPSLLRKATSSFSALSGQDEHGISTNTNARKAAVDAEVKGRSVGVAGSKKSSVNWYVREAERKKALEKRIGKGKASSGSVPGVKRQASGLSGLLGKTGAWD